MPPEPRVREAAAGEPVPSSGPADPNLRQAAAAAALAVIQREEEEQAKALAAAKPKEK